MAETPCTPCTEGRLRHFFKGGPVCLHCGAANPYQEMSAGSAGNTGNDDLDALRQEATAPVPLAPVRRRAAKVSPEDAQRLKRQRESIAGLIAGIPHQIQGQVAAMLYEYHGDAFNLTSAQKESLSIAWLQVLDAFDYDPTSPWVAVAVLGALEMEISMGQWRKMYQDVEPEKVER